MILFHRILVFAVTRVGYREIISDLLLLLCLVFAWFKPQLGEGFFCAVERAGMRLAQRKRLASVLLAAAAISATFPSFEFRGYAIVRIAARSNNPLSGICSCRPGGNSTKITDASASAATFDLSD